MSIGLRLGYLRKLNGFTLEELAHGVISLQHLSNIEKGRYKPNVDFLELFANKLNTTKEYLTEYDTFDNLLDSMLKQLEQKIIINTEEANEMIKDIMNSYSHIHFVHQEVHFNLLYTCFLYKTNQLSEAQKIEVEFLNFYFELIHHSTKMLRTYQYLLGLKKFRSFAYKQSIKYFKKYLSYVDDENTSVKAAINYNLALCYFRYENKTKSLEHAETSLQLYFKIHDWINTAETYNFIGALYRNLGEFTKAKDYFEKALDICNIIEMNKIEAKILHNLGLVSRSEKNYETAIDLFTSSLNEKLKIADCDIQITYKAIIETYLLLENFEEATKILIGAKRKATLEKDRYTLYFLEAKIYYCQNNPIFEAILKNTLPYFIETNQNNILWMSYEMLGNYYFLQKRYKIAAEYFKNALSVNFEKGEL